MSFLKSKHSGWSADGVRTPFFGGGGGGGPSQTTAYSTNIPEYARPYVENMLGATQAQIFNTTTNPDTGATEISGFKPYQPYSKNVNDYFAGFSPMQQQSFQGMANMQVAPQLAQGSQMASASGAGMLGTTGAAMGYGQQGASYGQRATGAGQEYQQMATDPAEMQKWMNPYVQQALAPQLALLNQQQALTGTGIAAKAAGQGAFGGNRATLAQGLNAQNYALAQQQAVGQGYNEAFRQAQQAQQFRSDLGLRGLQTGLQGAQIGLQGINAAQQGYAGANQAAATLGQLGQNQYAQQMGILQGQNQFGAQQQQLEQNKINQAISDYATAQQYPMLQLGLMSNMLRGLPMQAQTTQMYQAQPTYLQQGIGAMGSIGSLYGAGAFGKKEGGIVGYKYGGAIPEPKLAGMADKLDIPQLQQRLKDPQLDSGERQIFADALQDKTREKARYAGIAAAGGGLFEGQGYAGGGILAFADEGQVKDPQELADQINLVGAQLDTVNKEAEGMNAPGSRQRAYKSQQVSEYENLKKRQAELKSEYSDLMTKAGLDKPAFNYQPSRSLGGGVPTNSVEQAVLGQKPPAPAAQPTQAEWKQFDDATARFLADQKKDDRSADTKEGAKPATAPGTPGVGGVSTSGKSLADLLAERRKLGPQGEAGEDFMKFIEDRLGKSSERFNKADKLAAAKAFAEFGTVAAPGGIGQAISRGLGTYAGEYGKAIAAEDAITMEAQKLRKDLDIARRAEERGDVEGAQKAYDSAADRQNRIQTAQIQAAATMAGHGATQKAEAAAIERIMKEKGVGYTEALQLYKGAGKMESNDINAIKASIEVLQNSLLSPGMSKEDRAKVQQQIAGLNQQLIAIGSKGGAPTGGGGNLVQNKDGSFNYVPR